MCYFVSMEPKAYSVNQAAEVLGVSRATIYQLMREGKLFYATVGKRKRVPVEAIEAMLRGETYNPNAGPVETHQDAGYPPTPSLLA